jgi:hypothetical protein
MVIALILAGALIGALHQPRSEKAPVRATREVEARQQQEAQAWAYREEQREQRYAATPGPPYPVQIMP